MVFSASFFAPKRSTAPRVCGVLLAVSTMLTACGGGDAVSKTELTSVAPLDRDAVASTAAAAPTSLTDVGAHEISSIPSPTSSYEGREKTLLDDLESAGFKTDGIEEQLLGLANQLCAQQTNDLITAIISQLATQGYTSLDQEQALTAFSDTVQKNYCS